MKRVTKKLSTRKLKIKSGDELSIGIVLEDTQAKFTALLEAYGNTDARLERIEAKIDNHDARLDRIEIKLDSTVEMVGELNVKVMTVQGDVDILKEDVAFIKDGMRKKIEVEEFSALERRVLRLESHDHAKATT